MSKPDDRKTSKTMKKNQKGTGEFLAILDESSWIWSFIERQFQKLRDQEYLRLPGTTPIRRSWERFKNAPRIIIHWENKSRSGGAIIEEILDVDPLYSVAEKIIVVSTNPTHEDVVYFSELGVRRVLRLRNHEKHLKASEKELYNHLRALPDRSDTDRLWRKLMFSIDTIDEENLTVDFINNLEQKLDTIVETCSEAESARHLELRASIAALRKQDGQAADLWLRAIDKNPNYYRAHNNLIKFYLATGQKEEALSLMQRMQRLNKSNISRLVAMGQIHLEQDETRKAEHLFKSALERDKYCNGALNGMAEIRFKQGDLEESRKLLARSTKAEQAASRFNLMGIELVRKKKFEQALEHYTKAQYVLPQQEKGPLLFYNIGLCYSRWGKPEKAIEFVKIALIKEPNYSKAQNLLTQLLAKKPA